MKACTQSKMKLHLTTAENNHLITGHGAGFVEINKARYTHNLIVMADKLILDWEATDFASLNEAHLEQILDLKPELVLLGTGEKHQFLHPKEFRRLTEYGIPLECMTTAAACRTYNFLMSEGRNVAAALLI
jgi:uncharacterized protein